jgi:glycosyltransferase involved in cell wall biosynthesis
VPGRTGSLVPSGEAGALADAVLRHLEDRAAAEAMGRRGRDHVYPHLSIERLERDIRGLYHHLAEMKGLCGRVGFKDQPGFAASGAWP